MIETDINDLSKSVENVKIEDFYDDEIDEDFSKPQSELESNINFDIPIPLDQSELDEIQNVLKSKSGSELRDYLIKLMTFSIKDTDSFQSAQVGNNVKKTYGSSSKREIISVIMTVVNKQNKHIILNKTPDYLQTIQQETKETKETREELRQRLRNKIKVGDKTNMQKMYETLQEEYDKMQEQENPTDVEGGNGSEKKKKKKKKLDTKKLQGQLINQMATYMKNSPGGFTGNPTSA
jgi:hypothetical protein